MIQNYRKSISNSCTYVRTCCDQMWFKESVILASKVKEKLDHKEDVTTLITRLTSAEGKEWLCHTCANTILKGSLLKLAKQNGTVYPPKPAVLNLNQLVPSQPSCILM